MYFYSTIYIILLGIHVFIIGSYILIFLRVRAEGLLLTGHSLHTKQETKILHMLTQKHRNYHNHPDHDHHQTIF